MLASKNIEMDVLGDNVKWTVPPVAVAVPSVGASLLNAFTDACKLKGDIGTSATSHTAPDFLVFEAPGIPCPRIRY